MNFSERMADLFVHGQLVADLMEDGTKAIFALAAVSVANIFWTEQQESQRVKRIRDYSELSRQRGCNGVAGPANRHSSIVVHPGTDFTPRNDIPSADGRARRKNQGQLRLLGLCLLDGPGIILLFFGIVGMFTDTFAGATTPVSAVAKALAVCVITLFLLHYMGRWTSRALDNRFVRRFSQFFISLTLAILALIALAMSVGAS